MPFLKQGGLGLALGDVFVDASGGGATYWAEGCGGGQRVQELVGGGADFTLGLGIECAQTLCNMRCYNAPFYTSIFHMC